MGNKVRPPSEAGGVDVDDEDRCFHYRGYLLMCDPTRLLCGGYRAHAVVVKHDFIGSTTAASAPSNVFFLSKRAAIEHAKEWASHWVDAHWAV